VDRPRKRKGQRAEAGSDLDDDVLRSNGGALDDRARRRRIDEEVLPQPFLRVQTVDLA
jgi:hypothetical protein